MLVRIARAMERIIFDEWWTPPQFQTVEFWRGHKNTAFNYYDKENTPAGLKLPEDFPFFGLRNKRSGEFYGIIVVPPQISDIVGRSEKEIAEQMLFGFASQLVLDESIGKTVVYLRKERYDRLIEISQKLNVPKDRLIRRALDRYFRDGLQLDEVMVSKIGDIIRRIDGGADLQTIRSELQKLIECIQPKSTVTNNALPVDDDGQTVEKMIYED